MVTLPLTISTEGIWHATLQVPNAFYQCQLFSRCYYCCHYCPLILILIIYSIDRSRYYYSHLVVARGRGSRKPRVRVVWTNMTKECEVKCKYYWDIVQNKYQNLMMLHIWILCGEDLFSMGIYRLIQTKIYFTVCISMYVKSSVPACTWLILQRPLTATRWL